MRIVVPVIGTRGDVQPFAVLGAALAAAGHDVRVVTHERFRGLVEEHGLDFAALGGDPERMWEDRRWRELRVSAWDPRPHIRAIREVFGELVAASRPEELGRTWRDADLIVFSATTAFAAHVAGELRVPCVMGAATPMVVTGEFPHPVLAARMRAGRTANVASWLAAERLQGQAVCEPARPAERRRRGLPLMPVLGSRAHAAWPPFPVVHAFSPAVVPRPADWPPHVHETGWWLPAPGEGALPDAVEAFLADGPPPLFAGFGSMGLTDPETLGRTLVEALERSGTRAIVSGVDAAALRARPDLALVAGPLPHDRLFPRVAGVVHHGGSGTVGTSLRAGRPTLVTPFVFDQFFWGRRVAAVGAGPRPLPFAELAPEPLAERLSALGDPAIAAGAARVAAGIAADGGARGAAAVIERAVA